MKRLAVLASCLAVLGGCDKKDDAAKNGADKPAAAASAKPAIGMKGPGNDPKIVELAKKALGCKWEGKDDNTFAAFDAACPEYKAWKDEKEAFAGKKGEPTLVAFIEDPDEKVRYLGEKRLGDDLGLLTDQALAARVLSVAEKSKLPRDAQLLGVILGNIVLTDATLYPRIKTLFTSSKDVNLRNAIITDLLPSNPDNEAVFSWTRAVMKDTSDKTVSRTAMGAFAKMKTEKTARCDAWAENIENADPDHAGDAVRWMTQPQMRCEAHYDAVLKSIDARVKAKTAKSTFFPTGLEHICDAKGKATPPQVKTALGLAHGLAEDKALEGRVRASAIDASVACDPKGGKAYAGKFKTEKDQDIKDSVWRANKQK